MNIIKSIFRKKIKSVEELDELYEIIDDHNSWVEIRKKGDTSYWKDPTIFDAYKFSDGVKKFCLEQNIRLCFLPWDKCYFDVKSI